jgi:hypothetical protein
VGPLPQVLSVQGRTGAVVLSATDVGAASPTDLSTGLATKVNTATYTAGLAAKQDAATLGAAVAADATVRAAFAPPIDQIRVGGAALMSAGGSPVAPAGGVDGVAYWQLTDGSTDTVAGFIQPPSHWTAVNIEAHLFWSGTPGSLAVLLNAAVKPVNNGDRVDGGGGFTSGSNVTVPYTVQQFGNQFVTVATALTIDPTKLLYVQLTRFGADALDTYAVNLGLVGFTVSNGG